MLDDTVQLANGATITGAPITNDGTLEVLGAASLVNDQLANTVSCCRSTPRRR